MNQQKLYEKAPAYVCGESFLSDDDIISLMTLLSLQKGLFTPKSGLLLVQLRYPYKFGHSCKNEPSDSRLGKQTLKKDGVVATR